MTFFTAVSPMRNDLIGKGRPGGVAILWKKELQKFIQVQQTVSDKLCAITINWGLDKNSACVCICMPCDLGCVTSVDDYEEELDTWKALLITWSSIAKLSLVTLTVTPTHTAADLDRR